MSQGWRLVLCQDAQPGAWGGSGALAWFMRTGDSFTVNQVQMCRERVERIRATFTNHSWARPIAATPGAGGVNFAASWQDPYHTGGVPSHPSLDAWVQLPHICPLPHR